MFPDEPVSYRKARAKLLKAEVDLRRQVEAVAKLRRELPLGGPVPIDYVFHEQPPGARKPVPVRLSELFAPKRNTLVLYSFMYGPKMKAPCPMCTAFLDSIEGAAPHVSQQINLAVVAASPIERILAFTKARGWKNLRLISAEGTTYQRDYLGETKSGGQIPMLNVFEKADGAIHHAWASELMFADSEQGQDARHVDMLWPLWNVLDLTRGGRGATWYPKLAYEPAPAAKGRRSPS